MNGNKSRFSPNHVSRRRFIQSVSAGAVASAAIAGGVMRPLQAANAIPANRFGRMFPTLPSFASQSKKMEQALMALGEKGGLLDANDNLAAGPVLLITDPKLSENNPNNPT